MVKYPATGFDRILPVTCPWSWWQKNTSILHLDSLKLIYHCMHWLYFPDLSSIQTPVITSVTEATRPCRSIKCYKWSLSLSNNGGRRGLRALLRNNDECSLSLSLSLHFCWWTTRYLRWGSNDIFVVSHDDTKQTQWNTQKNTKNRKIQPALLLVVSESCRLTRNLEHFFGSRS